MKKTCISKDWYFCGPTSKGFEKIDLPHDYAVRMPRNPNAAGNSSTGFFDTGVGTYNKYLTLDAGKHYILDLDGSYMCTEIELNEERLALHPYGYTPFLVDLTEKMYAGKTNKIKLITNAMQPSTRWYSGAGVYRDVFLWEGGITRIEPRDIFVSTQKADAKEATVSVSYDITSDKNGTAKIKSAIFDKNGKNVFESVCDTSVKADKKVHAELIAVIKKPYLWELDSPSLYTLKTEVFLGDTPVDSAETVFGIRTISYDTENGFMLNGKTVLMRGGCIHHDHGVLGAAAFPAAEERKLSILKKTGFNAVRIAHYPPSLALLEICDRLGMLVMDEAFDMWNKEKKICDYHLWFADWWARDISYMVLRDRNHPCVVSYSIGNEISERDGFSDGALWARKLAQEIKKYDTTRPVTSGVCKLWGGFDPCDPADYREKFTEVYGNENYDDPVLWANRTSAYIKALDIVGYNYLYWRMENDAKQFPERIIWHSETHALNFYDSWQTVKHYPNVIGDFTWTCYDNLGEAGTGRSTWERDGHIVGISEAGYPWRNCFQGDHDLCGYRRPQSYFREAVWLGNTEPRIFTTHPEHFGEEFTGTEWHWYDVHESWTFDDKYIGQPVLCEVYTDADKIKWYINGKETTESIPEKDIARAVIPYEKGVLKAAAYKKGKLVGSYELYTTQEASRIVLEAEKNEIVADNRDLLYVDISVCDKDGRIVTESKAPLRISVTGGELMGIFSGDPANEDKFTSNECHAFEGRALAIIRTNAPGSIRYTVCSDGLCACSGTATAK